MKFPAALLCAVLAWPALALAGGEIYGTIHTDRGETLTGPIRLAMGIGRIRNSLFRSATSSPSSRGGGTKSTSC